MYKNLIWAVTLTSSMALAETVNVSNDVNVVNNPRSDETPNAMVFNAGDLINGVVNIEYERALTNWLGLTGGFAVTAYRGAFTPAEQASTVAIGPEFGARLHFIQNAPAGLWVGPYVSAVYLTTTRGDPLVRTFGWNLGGSVGYNFVLGKHFLLSVGAGGGFNDYGGPLAWAPRLRVALGGVF